MVKTYEAPYGQTPFDAAVGVTQANTDLDDNPTNTALLVTAGADGAIVTALWCIPRATVTAGVAYIYRSTDNGATQVLWLTAAVPANSVSTTSAPLAVPFKLANGFAISEEHPLRLAAGTRLYFGFSLAVAGGITGCATGMHY